MQLTLRRIWVHSIVYSIYCLHSKVFYTAALRQGELISQRWSQYSYDEQQNASMKIQELISNFTSYDESAISLNVKGQKGYFLKMHVLLSISS